MKTKLIFMIMAIVINIRPWAFAQSSNCDFLKLQKDYDNSSYMSSWVKNKGPYDINFSVNSGISKTITIEIIHGEKRYTLNYNFENENKLIKSEEEILEIAIVNKASEIIRTYHFVDGIDLKQIIPYSDTSSLRVKPYDDRLLLSSPKGEYIINLNLKDKTYCIGKNPQKT